MTSVYKSEEFISSFAHIGKDVRVFSNALILKPEMICLSDGVRIDKAPTVCQKTVLFPSSADLDTSDLNYVVEVLK